MQKQLAAVGDALDRLLEPANLIQAVIVVGHDHAGLVPPWRLIQPRFRLRPRTRQLAHRG